MQLSFRPIEEEDRPFLMAVYATTRAEEMAMVPWSEQEKSAFLEMQFQAQHTHYHKESPDAQFDIILLEGEPVGRLYVERREDELHIIDIALLPDHRGKGIGGRIFADLIEEAESKKLPVRIYVEHNNRARTLYDRLGFKQIKDVGLYFLLERPSGG